MKQRYRIREAARLVGMTSEALRYYEREKLIVPFRDEENDYRYYTKFSLLRLNNCKRLQSMRFSLKEINQILKEDSVKDFAGRLAEKRAEIKASLEYWKVVEAFMAEYETQLRELPEKLGTFELCEVPDCFYIIQYEDMNFLTDNGSSSLYPKWLSCMPLARMFTLSPRESVTGKPPLLRKGGLAMTAAHAAFCGTDTDKSGVRRIPGGTRLRTFIEIENNDESINNRFKPALSYMKEHGLELSGDPYGFQLFKNYHELSNDDADPKAPDFQGGNVFYEYYLPVKK